MEVRAASLLQQYRQVRRLIPGLPTRLPACLVRNLAHLTELKVTLSKTALECLTLTGEQRWGTDRMFRISLSRAFLRDCRSAQEACAEINRALAGIQPDLTSQFIIDSVTLKQPSEPKAGIEFELDCDPFPVLLPGLPI